MRRFATLLLITVFAGCSPVYSFRVLNTDQAVSALDPINKRVDGFLAQDGFVSLGHSDVATGDIGCGRDAHDRATFQKEWRDTSWLPSYHWVWVHRFSCDGDWYLVIVSSTNAEAEASELEKALVAEFSPEISSGMMAC